MTTFKPVFEGAQEAFRAEPEQALATFAAESRQVRGLESKAEIRGFSLTVDEPEELGGSDQGPNPIELVLASLATCQEITYRLYADALGIPLDGVSVKVSGDIDLRGFFAVDPETRAGFGAIRAEVTLDSPAPAADLERLKAAVDEHCPVLDILRNPVPTATTLARPAAAAAE